MREQAHDSCDYVAFGYYNGLSVGANLFQEKACSLECLWEYEREHLQRLGGTYSEKIAFGFRTEDEDSEGKYIKDDEFWGKAKEEKAEYPFIFVSMLKIKANEQDMNL